MYNERALMHALYSKMVNFSLKNYEKNLVLFTFALRIMLLSENQLTSAVEQVSNDLFFRIKYQAFLDGKQISEFCHYEQINRFLLFQIYIDWKSHVQKLKHPYFDFQHPEVKEALEDFLNVLSNHIHVEQKDFKILLKKAVYNTIKLLNEPLNSFLNFFFATKNEVSTALITQYIPYFYDFDFILQSILLYAENHQLEKISKELFQTLYQKAIVNYERFAGESIENYRTTKLKELLGNSLNNLENQLIEKKNTSFPSQAIEPETPVLSSPTIPTNTSPTPIVKESIKVSSSSTKKEIKIKKIPLNKQFQYSQKLFKGDLEALKKFCDQIAELQDLEMAKQLIQTNVIENYKIDPEDALFQEFASIALAHIL